LRNGDSTLVSALFRWVYFRADACIVLATVSICAAEFATTSRFTCNYGRADEVFRLADKQRMCRARGNALKILFLARVEKAKGIYEAVDAFRIVQAKHSSVCLTIAGDGSELKSVKEYVRAQNIEGITFLGWVRGPSKLEAFAKADVYLFPTHHGEGMPNSVLEAMACGLPVVTRPVGGVRDFFENGRMGFLTEGKEPQVLASLLEVWSSMSLRRQMVQPDLRDEQISRITACASTGSTGPSPDSTVRANASQRRRRPTHVAGTRGAGSVQEQTDERR
jgi:glycosyltransferase involved in cell wall biosynthesis